MLEEMSDKERALFKESIEKKGEENQLNNNNNLETSSTSNTLQSSINTTRVSRRVITAKEDRFSKLVKRRLPKTLQQLDLLANLSVISRHEYTEEQANNLVNSLQERVSYLKVLLERGLELQDKRNRKQFITPQPLLEEDKN